MKEHTGREWYVFPLIIIITVAITGLVSEVMEAYRQPFFERALGIEQPDKLISSLEGATFIGSGLLATLVIGKVLRVRR